MEKKMSIHPQKATFEDGVGKEENNYGFGLGKAPKNAKP